MSPDSALRPATGLLLTGGGALACGADDFDRTVPNIVGVWKDIHADQVYRSDSFSMVRSGATLMALLALGWVMSRWRHKKPRSLLDNAPLGKFLSELVPLERLPDLIRAGHIPHHPPWATRWPDPTPPARLLGVDGAGNLFHGAHTYPTFAETTRNPTETSKADISLGGKQTFATLHSPPYR